MLNSPDDELNPNQGSQNEQGSVEEALRDRNLKIYRKLWGVFEEYAAGFDRMGEPDYMLIFRDKDDPRRRVDLHATPHEEIFEGMRVEDADSGIIFVIDTGGTFENYHYDPRARESAAGKILPRFAIDPKGGLVRFENQYYFDEDGNSGNADIWFPESQLHKKPAERILREDYDASDEDIEKIKHLESMPRLRNPKTPLLPLNEYDYERAETIVKGIEDRDWVFQQLVLP